MKIFVLLALLVGMARAESLYDVDPLFDGAITTAGFATVAATYLLAPRWIKKRCPCDSGEVNGLDRGGVGNKSQAAEALSDVLMVAAVAGPVVADWALLGVNDEFLSDVLVYAQSLAVGGAMVSLVKHVVQRPLPRTYAGDPEVLSSEEGYRSFYSGHVATTVTALSVASFTVARRYSTGVWPWIVTAAAGTAVGVGRIAAGNHFFTDVLVGMAAGVLVGVGIPWLHTHRAGQLVLLPSENGPQLGWYLRL